MSSIPTKQIDGDVSVGRNVSVGGGVNVQGSQRVGHNLTVEGWLEAKNIKGPNKGIFTTEVKLRTAYPHPHDGWWALVGNTLPAPLYIADGGTWVKQVDSSGAVITAGNPTIDSQQYQDAVNELDGQLQNLAATVAANKSAADSGISSNSARIDSILSQITLINNSITTNTSSISTLKGRVDGHDTSIANNASGISKNATDIKAIQNSVGAPSGIAPLNENGRIPARYIPGAMDDVKEFDGFVPISPTTIDPVSLTDNCLVVFDSVRGTFIACAKNAIPAQYASNWLNADSFGEFTMDGRIPEKDKVYVDRTTNKTYRWSGSQMVVIGSDLALGYTESTAFPGDDGAKLQTDLATTNKTLGELNSREFSHFAHISILPFNGFYEDNPDQSTGVWVRKHDQNEGGTTYMWANEWPDGLSAADYNTYFRGIAAIRTDVIYRLDNELYRYNGTKLVKVGGNAIGNTYNATVELPLEEGEFYSDFKDKDAEQEHNVLEAVFNEGIAVRGMTLTFAIGEGKWRTYQYVGTYLTKKYFTDPDNWITMGGGSSTGNTINVHEVSGNWNYMSRGVAASLVPEDLRTGGRKITFSATAGVWQTWQFLGTTSDKWVDENYWKPEVQGVSFNGGEAKTPDAEGNINIDYKVEVDETPNAESSNPIANKAVVQSIKEVQDTIPQGLSFDAATRILSLNDANGEGIASVTIPGGGGGGTTNPTAIELTINSAMSDTLKEGDDYTIEFVWRHYNMDSSVDTQYGGTAELIVNGSTVDRMNVEQGICSFKVGEWLSVGTNSVRVKITADDGVIAQSAYIKLNVVTLSLSSPYAISTATQKGSAIPFRYVVNGSGTKKVTFKLDGALLSEETITTSGATSVKSIATTNLSHGAHRLEVYAEREISAGQTLTSNVLVYDLIVIEADSLTPIIAVELNQPNVNQYETIEIPYAVYIPNKQQGQVVISLNGKTLQTATVDRVRTVFSYRAKEHGELKFIFICGATTKEVKINVIEAATQIEAETDALALYLSSSGRSNDADDANVWEFASEDGQHTKAIFSNCDFKTHSGWMRDSTGLMALHLEKGATCVIPHQIFSKDCKLTGKTIEIEFMVSNCYDMDATLISCLSGNVGFEIKAQEVYFTSALKKTIETKYKQDERIRLGFQVEQVGGNRFLYLFINGKMSNVVQYDTSDYFVQNPAVGITLGHPMCELNVYNIRVYDNVLSFRQMVNNYIADMDDTAVMFKKLEANDILNEDGGEGDIDYDKAVQKIPCITFIGELPKFKGDKKKDTKAIYEDRQHPEQSFNLPKAQNDVQGTSSQYYPRKNWKFKALVDFIMSQTGASAKKYALRIEDRFGKVLPQKAVNTFCLKADFAESSGTHNTGAANFIHEVLKNAGILTPMQEVDDTVRTTVAGFPILMFHQETESSPRKFIGKYNFNNDKSTQDTFGFENIKGFNEGMVNRDDYLMWYGTLDELNANTEADTESLYLVERTGNALHNHLLEFNAESGAWTDKGEMWRWKAATRVWANNAGQTCTRTDVMSKVAEGVLIENNIECWEFLNNGHPMCLFHTSDYTSKVYGSDIPSWMDSEWLNSDDKGKYAPYWAGAFEPRYPDNDDNNKQYAQGKIPEQLKRVTDWLASLELNNPNLTVEQKKAKGITFAGQVERYFNKKMLLAYDILRQLMVMADQGAKNMMWAIIDGIVYIIFYDNDTIWLINNEGRLMFIPYVEPHSKDSLGKFVFNGESSNLWNAIENSSLETEKAALYNTMVSQGGMTYETALLWFNSRQSDMWSETVYNADAKYKYIDSFGKASEDGSGAAQNYLDIAQGSREEHRKWAMYERFQYMNAKYCTGTYRDSYVYLRANTAGESSVPSKVEVNVTAAQDWYFGFRFSGNAGYTSHFVNKGDTYIFTAPDGANPNDTECYIHQADRISDLGDLSVLYPTTLQIGSCKMLTRLVVGNKTEGYIGKLANLTFGTHPLLTYINVCNCPTLQTSLDLQGCSALDEIEAQGSQITGVNLPTASTVSKMHLPETIVQLQFNALNNLTNANLVIDGYSKVQTIDIQNCAKLNPMEIVEAVTSCTDCSLQYIRVTGITLRGSGEELISLIDLGVHGAEDRNGKPEIQGIYEIVKLPTTEMLERIDNGINGITITIVVEAYTDTIDEVNGETYGGESEVETVTLDNIAEHLRYYNGETFEELTARLAEENRSIHEIITL